jgi:hypothetical protein
MNRGAVTAIALAVFVLLVGSLAGLPLRRTPPSARQVRQALFEELQPVVLKNCTLERFGGANDGGYLMCANLLGDIRSGYSYGIGPHDDWGCEVSRRHDVAVHQYDCFDPGRPACPGGRTVFHDECIGPSRDIVEARLFDTLTRQIARNGDAGKQLAVKIDVEGAEVESLLATPDRVLRRIDQLAMEIHGVTPRYLDLVRKLKRTFHFVHLHFNNNACTKRYRPFPAWAYQVLLVNRRLGVVDPAAPEPVLPRAQDAPDSTDVPDCQRPLDPEES